MSLLNAVPKPAPRPKRPRKALKRSWMRKKPPRRLSRAGSDPAYLAFVRTLPCAISSDQCFGRIHAHHAIHRSQGGKDSDAIPLCMHHHAQWHLVAGPFKELTKMERFAWSYLTIAKVQAARGGPLKP